jgi:hypothetical protein
LESKFIYFNHWDWSDTLTGLTECLQREFATLFDNSVRFIIFEPGYFRTEVFAQTNVIHLSAKLPEYETFSEAVGQHQVQIHHKENGDPVKGVARMIDILTSTGMAAGKDLPPRLPLGTDSLEVIRNKCQATLQLCDEWEDLIVSTDAVAEIQE